MKYLKLFELFDSDFIFDYKEISPDETIYAIDSIDIEKTRYFVFNSGKHEYIVMIEYFTSSIIGEWWASHGVIGAADINELSNDNVLKVTRTISHIVQKFLIETKIDYIIFDHLPLKQEKITKIKKGILVLKEISFLNKRAKIFKYYFDKFIGYKPYYFLNMYYKNTSKNMNTLCILIKDGVNVNEITKIAYNFNVFSINDIDAIKKRLNII